MISLRRRFTLLQLLHAVALVGILLGAAVSAWDVWNDRYADRHVWRLAFSADGRLMAVGVTTRNTYGKVKVWDLASERVVFEANANFLTPAAFSSDGALAVAVDNSTVQVFDAATWEARQTFEAASELVVSLAFSPDSKTLAVGEGEGNVTLWDAASTKQRSTIQAHRFLFVDSLAFMDHGEFLATAGLMESTSPKSAIKLWNVQTGEQRALLKHGISMLAVAASPDGRTLASWDASSVKAWDVVTGEERFEVPGFSLCAAFHPNSRILAVGAAQRAGRSVALWDVETGRKVSTLGGFPVIVSCLAFTSDGNMLAAAGNDDQITVYDFGSSQLRTIPLGEAPTFPWILLGGALLAWCLVSLVTWAKRRSPRLRSHDG